MNEKMKGVKLRNDHWLMNDNPKTELIKDNEYTSHNEYELDLTWKTYMYIIKHK